MCDFLSGRNNRLNNLHLNCDRIPFILLNSFNPSLRGQIGFSYDLKTVHICEWGQYEWGMNEKVDMASGVMRGAGQTIIIQLCRAGAYIYAIG